MVTVLGLIMIIIISVNCPITWIYKYGHYWQTAWIVAGVVIIGVVNWP